ncbi:phosphotransferase [Pseudonocardia humida]|uniref:Phosphotransferase n=1 Tax=Pseudonocardia humida TaxID=2800819 RepID=A0ABT1A2F5_9PSEU|nr:phosphotransferase [Pseudonocardia humida]MCO1657196.1 phosphotransferase [Pseudonocardia humida]
MKAAAEIPLHGGTANRGRVHRVGDTVRRPLRPTSAATHALLRHLQDVGFEGAPRVLGVDGEGREVLSYVPGEAVTAPAPAWGLTDAALVSVGRLLRRFHEAAAGFDPTPYTWSHAVPAPFDGAGVAHNDPNLDNVVFRDGVAVALIDFDLAAPGAPLWDVAAAARLWAPLRAPVDVADARRFRALRRLRILVDAYGLDERGRADLLTAVLDNHEWMCEIVRTGAAAGVPGFAEYWTPDAVERNARARRWLHDNADAVAAALA